MAKILLGNPPKNFTAIVAVTMLDGSTEMIECKYKYRTRKEFAELIEQITNPKQKSDAQATYTSVINDAVEINGEYLLKIMDGWSLDVDFNAKTTQQLCDEYPAVANAMMERYRVAINEGTIKN